MRFKIEKRIPEYRYWVFTYDPTLKLVGSRKTLKQAKKLGEECLRTYGSVVVVKVLYVKDLRW